MASSVRGGYWSLLLFLLLVMDSGIICASHLGSRHLLLSDEDEGEKPVAIKKKLNQTKTGASNNKLASSKNQTKMVKSYDAPKDKIKLLKSIDLEAPTLKPKIKKLNSTTSDSSVKASALSTPTDLAAAKNKTAKLKEVKAQLEAGAKKVPKKQQPSSSKDEDDDLVAEFRELPAKFQETIVPDLQRISKTSKSYLNRYNKEFAKGFKPYVGNKYASTIASIVSLAFILIPLILVSLIFNRIKAHFSLQKMLIFIQIYLAIYFSILCLSSLVTGLEPLRFFYTSSQSTYVCVQVLQTLSYVLYLLLLLMYLILVFSTETGLGTRLLSLGYTFVGFAVGLHYYMTVFHRAILRQLPKTSWKVHALYAASFILLCLLGRLDRGKKAYFEGGEDEGKKN